MVWVSDYCSVGSLVSWPALALNNLALIHLVVTRLFAGLLRLREKSRYLVRME
jgi:hypothetical protein